MSMPLRRAFACLLPLLFASPAALADEGSHWYAGISYGGSQFDVDDHEQQIEQDLALTSGTAASVSTRRDSDSGLKVYGGYSFTRYLGVEFGFVSPGEAVLQAETPGEFFAGHVDMSGWFGALVATLPLGEKFSLHAKGGPFSWKQETDMPSSSTATRIAGNSTGFDFMLGAGAGYEVNEDVGLRVEFERFQMGDDSFDYISAGLLFRF